MATRAQQMLLCVSIAVLLVTLCCNASPSLRSATGTRSVLSSTSVLEADSEVPRNDIEEEVPTSALQKAKEFNQWAQFQAQKVTEDYNPPEANPDPGNPSLGIGD